MRKRPLGKTGLIISELALGTWGLAGEAYGPVDAHEAERVVRRALEIGVTLVDTSDAYGAGKIERLVGSLASAFPDVVVVTRGGIDRTTEPARKRFDALYLRDAVERSCKRLGTDALTVYLLHHPTAATLYGGEAVDALTQLKTEGKIRHWGVAAGDEDVARAAIDQGAEVLELAYSLMNPLDLHRLAGDLMISGAGVLARSVLAYGLLAGQWAKDHTFPDSDHRNDRWTKLELEHRIDQLDAIRYLIQGDVFTMRAAAVRFVLAHHLVSSAVLGPRTVTQLEQLIRETGGGPRYLRDEDLRKLPRSLERVGISC